MSAAFVPVFDRMKAAPNQVVEHLPGPNPQIATDDWRAAMNGTRRTIRAIDQVAAFWAKVDRTGGPDACWTWTAAVNPQTGYGAFHPSRSSGYPHTVSAHRFAAHLAGVIDLHDASQHVDHECHNGTTCPPGPCMHRRCCNPAHHRARTKAENVNASHNSNAKKTHCPNRHEYTPENTRIQKRGTTTIRKCIACERERDRARSRKDVA